MTKKELQQILENFQRTVRDILKRKNDIVVAAEKRERDKEILATLNKIHNLPD